MDISCKELPNIRFSNFIDSYRKSKIGDFYKNLRTGMTPSRTKPDYFKGSNLWITSGELDYNYISDTNEKITNEAIFDTNLVLYPPNTLFIAITGLEAPGTRGRCAFNKLPATTNQSCLAFLENENIDSVFLFYWYQKYSERLYFKFAQGTKQQSFNNKIVEKFTLIHPQLREQQKIASFLSSVDEKIKLLRQKKELLQEYKKGAIQKIFNQEIRFKDSNGKDYPEWKEEKLNSIIIDFIVPMRDKPKSLKGEIPWCRIEDFDGKYLYESKSNQGVDEDTVKKMNLKIYPIDTLLVSCSANLGFCAVVKKELITNQTFIGLVPNKNKISIDFLYHTMKKSSRKLNTLSSGTTIAYLSRKEFERFKIPYPELDEQVKIATFLDSLDNKITHLNTELDNTQLFKKGLLQQMLV